MANKTYAVEWLTKSNHDLVGAKLLFEADHYTDTIGYVLHQSLEKMLKSILDDEKIYLLSIATTYQTQQRYPVVQKKIPQRDEISQILQLSQELFEDICSNLSIDKTLI